MTDAELVNECANMVLTAADELRQRPLYLVDVAGLDVPKGSCLGWASADEVDYSIAQSLGERWTEDGPVIGLDFAAIAKQANPGKFRQCALGVACHEAAHILPERKPWRLSCPTEKYLDWQRCTAAKELTAPSPTLENDLLHGPGFIRKACHVWARATIAGFQPTLDGLLSWPSKAESYVLILLKEIFEMRALSFTEILAQPAPEDFFKQWQADLDFSDRITKREKT